MTTRQLIEERRLIKDEALHEFAADVGSIATRSWSAAEARNQMSGVVPEAMPEKFKHRLESWISGQTR